MVAVVGGDEDSRENEEGEERDGCDVPKNEGPLG